MNYDIKEFDEIRPYHDEELPAIYEQLLTNERFINVLKIVFPQYTLEQVRGLMYQCKTKLDFQKAFSFPFLEDILKKTSTGIVFDHKKVEDISKAHLYLSNHRDIILDSAFLADLFLREGCDTQEVAVGDNLLAYPWIEQAIRINKSFIVQRGLTMRQVLISSARMSRYMHYAITEKNQSIWMAQREGRSKDSSDHTQDSLLKMLAMGGEGTIIDRLQELNILPLAISYEYDSCDYLKAKEFQQKRDDANYEKTPKDDLINMEAGTMGYKGHITFRTSSCINPRLALLPTNLCKSELIRMVAELIDKEIHSNYELYPSNYIAYDLLLNRDEMADKYTVKERVFFVKYIDSQLDKIDLPNKDMPFLYKTILEMYANPVVNYIKATADDE